jgi:hypothetical protein
MSICKHINIDVHVFNYSQYSLVEIYTFHLQDVSMWLMTKSVVQSLASIFVTHLINKFTLMEPEHVPPYSQETAIYP